MRWIDMLSSRIKSRDAEVAYFVAVLTAKLHYRDTP